MTYLVRATYLAAASASGVPMVLYLKDVGVRSASSWTDRRDAASRVGAAEATRLVAEMTGQYFATDYWAVDAVALEEVTGG